MGGAPFVVTLHLTMEEAATLTPILEVLQVGDQRVGLLAARVAARIADQLEGLQTYRAQLSAQRMIEQRVKDRRCPIHGHVLRLDRTTIGQVIEIFYCPTRGCTQTYEVSS